jgi:hypothetical protein
VFVTGQRDTAFLYAMLSLVSDIKEIAAGRGDNPGIATLYYKSRAIDTIRKELADGNTPIMGICAVAVLEVW